jgi:hypothetical protein
VLIKIWGKQVTSRLTLALLLPQLATAQGGAQIQGLGLLTMCDVESLLKGLFGGWRVARSRIGFFDEGLSHQRG